MAQTIIHPADTRGIADHGWLNSKHTFNFANYYNPERIHFGALRVLNDDTVAGGMGFGQHPHDNMEIVSIPLSGDLLHKDSMGNEAVIRHGDVQLMSAGTGVRHSEYNANAYEAVKFLQIWIIPNERDVTPRYDQITLNSDDRKNKLQQIISPNANDEGLWIHQNAWFHIGDLEQNYQTSYTIKSPGNGAYIFVLNGSVQIDNTNTLNTRDGMGIWDIENIDIKALSDVSLLIIEVPMYI